MKIIYFSFLPVVLINKTEEKPFLKSADSKVSKTCDEIRVRTNRQHRALIIKLNRKSPIHAFANLSKKLPKIW